MSGKRFERPSSAKRSIKQECFSPYVSSARLRRLQSLLVSPKNTDPQTPDSLLCILGVDSRYNDGSTELANYLFFSFFELRGDEFENAPFGEETIDDVMVLVRHDSVDVYCNPINYPYLLPYMAHWRNLHLHCLNDKQYEDDERAEEFKIESLINMTHGCKVVAVPYSGTAGKPEFDIMAVEKWPVVQGFALEGFGSGGFFTMKYDVLDISPQLVKVYNTVDTVTLETLVVQQMPQFTRQWDAFLYNIDCAQTKGVAHISNETTVSEPLRSYFKHGRSKSAIVKDKSASNQHPFVLYGRRSCAKGVEAAQKGSELTDGLTLANAGPNNTQALHLVCQSVAPRSPISCMRTYFLSSGFSPYPVSSGVSEAAEQGKHVITDTQLLQQCYMSCMEAVLAAIEVYADTLNIKQAEKEVMRVMSSNANGDKHLNTVMANKKSLNFKIEAFHNHNGSVGLSDGEWSVTVKVASLVICDVTSMASPGTILGSVAFSETFLHSAIFVAQPDGSSRIDSDYMILTSPVPRLACWPISQPDSVTIAEVKAHTTSHSDAFIQGEETSLLLPHFTYAFTKGSTYVFEEEVVFSHKQTGPIVIPLSMVEHIHLYDGDSPSVVALLLFSVKPELINHLPVYLRSERHQVALALTPKSKAYKALFSKILAAWKDREHNPLQMLEELPPEMESVYNMVQQSFNSALNMKSPLKKAQGTYPTLTSFLEHFASSSILEQHSLPSKDLAAVLNQPSDSGSFDDPDEIILTIVGGIPGSHKENLCTTLTKLAKEDNKWAVFKHPLDNIEGFSVKNLQQNLKSVLVGSRRKKPAANKKKMRALILSPGYTDPIDIVRAIVTHPDKDVASKCRIGAVTVCVDQNNVYMEDRYLFPKLLAQCNQGWVNNIVFTGGPSQKSAAALVEVQSLMRSVNSDVALLLAERGEVTRGPDIELILSDSAFTDAALTRVRHLACPGWTSGKFKSGSCRPVITDHLLKFSQPLEKSKLVTKLRGIKAQNKGNPFSGNIYSVRGRVQFTDTDQVYQVMFVVQSGHLDITQSELPPSPPSSNGPTKADHPYCMVFGGCDLREEKLKDWMRSCVKQRPSKKPLRTRKSLSRTEINNVHTKHHLEALPEGWYYNGTQYLSLAGDKSPTHPNLEMFLENHLKQLNADIEKYNASIGDDEVPDMFA